VPYTEKQRRAAYAELGRRRKGGKARNFKGMSAAELGKYAHHKLEKKKSKKK